MIVRHCDTLFIYTEERCFARKWRKQRQNKTKKKKLNGYFFYGGEC